VSFVGAGQGNIRYSIILDDIQAVQKIGQFKTALNGITQPSQTVAQNIGTLNTNFASISTGLTKTNTGFTQTGAASKTLATSLTGVNTGFITLGTGINGLATPTRTLTTNMGALGNNFKLLGASETQTVTQTNAFKTGITALTTPTQQVGTNMKNLVGNMGPLAGNFQKATGAAKDMVAQEKNLATSSQSLGSKVKDNISRYSNLAIGLSTTITSGINLVRSLRDLGDAHLAVDKAVRKQSTANEALEKATNKVVKLEKEGKKGTTEYASALRDQEQATQGVEIANTNASMKQKEYNDNLLDTAVSVIPTVIGTIGTLGSTINDAGVKGGTLNNTFTKMKAGALGFGSSIKGLPAALTGVGSSATLAGGGLGNLIAVSGPIAGLINNIRVAIELLPKTLGLFTGSIDERIQVVRTWFNTLKELSVTGGLAELIDRITGLGPAFDTAGAGAKGANDIIKTIPPSMNTAATSTSALVNRIIVLRTQAEKGQITWNQYFDALAALKIPGDKFTATMDEVNMRMKQNIPLTKSVNDGFKITSSTFAEMNKFVGGVGKDFVELGNSVVLVTHQTDPFNAGVAKMNANLDDTAKKAAALKGTFATMRQFVGGVGKDFVEVANGMALVTHQTDPFNAGLSLANQTLPKVHLSLRQLADDSKFLAKMDELAWGAPATSRFAKLTTFGTKAYDEIAKKAEDARTKAEAFAQSVETARQALQKGFSIKSGEVDKVIKQFEKMLPNKVSKKIKLDLKFDSSVQATREALQNLLKEASQLDEGTAESMAKTMIKLLDKQFGKKVEKAFPGLTAALKAAIADPNTPAALAKLIETYPWLANIKPIPVPTGFVPPTVPVPSPKTPVQVPSVFNTPPPIPPPKTPVKVPAVLVWGGSSNMRTGSQAGAYGGPNGKQLKKIGGQFPNEFTMGVGNDVLNRMNNAGKEGGKTGALWGTQEGDVLGDDPKLQGQFTNPLRRPKPVSSGGGGLRASARGSLGLGVGGGGSGGGGGVLLAQVVAVSKAIMDLGKLQPQITLLNTNAITAIQTTSGEIVKLGTIKPFISLMNNNAITAIQTTAGEITNLGKIKPQISLMNNNAISAISTVAGEIDKLTKLKPQISLQNRNAISAIDTTGSEITKLGKLKPQISLQNRNAINAIDTVAGQIDKLTKIKPQISLQNRNAFNAVDAVAGKIMDLEKLHPTVTVHVKTVGGAISAQKGLHAYLLEDTTIMAHKGERVDIGHGGEGKGGGVTFNNMGGGSGGGDIVVNLNISGNEIVNERKITRRIKASSGSNRFTLGV
jgi:hypothetical protein